MSLSGGSASAYEGGHVFPVSSGKRHETLEQEEQRLAEERRTRLTALLKGEVPDLPTEVPDFSAVMPVNFQSPYYDPRHPKVQTLAQKLWPEFALYLWVRRTQRLGTLTPGLSKIYPLRPDSPLSFIFTAAESMIQKNDEEHPGELNPGLIQDLAQNKMSDPLSSEQMGAAFLLAFAFPASSLRKKIEAAVLERLH